MKTIISELKLKGLKCSGCMACKEFCSKNAIQMVPNAQGFLYPEINNESCIHCSRCIDICPILNWEPKKNLSPTCYAAKANKETRANASSGGVFPLLSKWVLSQNGIVYGAAMDDLFTVKHIRVTKAEDAPALYRSKYVQSSMEGIYEKIRQDIKSKKKILFSGTPCQVAAVKNFIGKDIPENLFLVDIICHGVPSPQMWKDYLRESFDIDKIQCIYFRNKEPGWRSDELLIVYKNGERELIGQSDNPYEEGFISYLSLRDGCEDCVFACEQRPGDLSIGDFWGIEKYDSDIDDHFGISEILVNNSKGRDLLNQIQDDFLTFREFPLDCVKENRLQPIPVNPLKERFKLLYHQRGFNEAIKMVSKKQYDIGLVAHYCAQNYGAQLTQWALYQVLTNSGLSVLMIERPRNATPKLSNPKPNLFSFDPYPDYAKSELFSSTEDMKVLNERCRIFVTGSDQMFNPFAFLHMQRFQALNFVTDDHLKIGYAISWGRKDFPNNQSILAEEAYYLGKFDAISAREDSGCQLLRENLGITNVENVLDPVLLCSTDEIDVLIRNEDFQTDIYGRYICVYVLDVSIEQLRAVVHEVQKSEIKNVLMFINPEEQNKEIPDWYNNTDDIHIEWLSHQSVESWITIIKGAEYVITDSYHGTCLAILFGRQFICMANKVRGVDRFTSLLHLLELDDRLSFSWRETEEKFNNLMNNPISYEKVNKILEQERKKSKDWLFNAIYKHKPNQFSVYDVLDNKIAKENRNIEDICKEIQAEIIRKTIVLTNEIHILDEKNQLLNMKNHENEIIIQQLLRATRWRRKAITAVKYTKQEGIISTVSYIRKKLGNRIKTIKPHKKSK